jgi:hypothetical protein
MGGDDSAEISRILAAGPVDYEAWGKPEKAAEWRTRGGLGGTNSR